MMETLALRTYAIRNQDVYTSVLRESVTTGTSARPELHVSTKVAVRAPPSHATMIIHAPLTNVSLNQDVYLRRSVRTNVMMAMPVLRKQSASTAIVLEARTFVSVKPMTNAMPSTTMIFAMGFSLVIRPSSLMSVKW